MKKQSKAERLAQAKKDMELFLLRMGYKGPPKESVNEIPDYRKDYKKCTSDKIPGNGTKMKVNRYTGDELLGISTMHKSNAVPIRKDNKQSAVDLAQMRRN